MHRRARHLNPASAGATFIFDSRFIQNVANNSTLSTWVNRAGTNNATQTTEANKPTYKTNILNGNPVCEFDSASDYMTFSKLDATIWWAFSIVKKTGSFTYNVIFQVLKTDGSNPTIELSVNTTGNGPVAFGSLNSGAGTVWPKGSSLRTDEWRSLYVEWFGGSSSGFTNYAGYDDGQSFAVSNTPVLGNDPNSTSFIGYPGFSFNGQIALIVFAPTQSSNSLRKRISHSGAFSFKLACA